MSKGAPKKMIQLFESFVDIHIKKDEKSENTLFVRNSHSSRHFLSFNYYKQYTLGIIAYLITPIFYRLAESNIKEHSDKLLVSALRFVDFVFKFHKHSFSWKHLDMSPEMLEVNRAPELKSVAVDFINYLSQVHINKSNFSLSDYKFDGLIANEIFAMAKTDDVFSALFSFSLDEMSPLKKHYRDLLEKTKEEYQNEKTPLPAIYIEAISSLQSMLGDLYYYDDGLEEAEAYYKSSVQALRENEYKITHEQLYVYVRNMLRLGIIYEKRKQYDFAYLTYDEICKRIAQGRYIRSECLFQEKTFDGLKMLYLPFIAKLQIHEKSNIGGIASKHLEQLDNEFNSIKSDVMDHKNANILEAEFYSRVADILYYKNADLKCKKNKNRKEDKNKEKDDNTDILPKNYSCTACYYYHKALSILLNLDKTSKDENTVIKLLRESVKQIEDSYNMKFCTVLARILSDWGNVFFSCDNKGKKNECGCYIYDAKDCNTRKCNLSCACYICDIDNCEKNNFGAILEKYINYIDSESKKENRNALIMRFDSGNDFSKMEIAFAMYSISLHAYRKANLHKRSAYQIYKMLCLFKHYEIYKCEKSKNYIEKLSKKAIHSLWRANEKLGIPELNKRKKDFEKETIKDKDKIPLHYLLVDSEITRIRILVKELELKSNLSPETLNNFYRFRITSPYRINYSIVGRIYRLQLKSMVNYEAYKMLIPQLNDLTKSINMYNDGSGDKPTLKSKLENDLYAIYDKDSDKFIQISSEINYILKNESCNKIAKEIFGKYFGIKDTTDKINILENLIAETIYCLIDTAQLLETMDETYLFPHSFLGSIHKHLSFWIRLYETYEIYIEEHQEICNDPQIKKYLERYLDQEWRELLSGYRENQKALSHYHKCLEMHSEGRAYHNMIDTMCYIRDDYNDRSDHFNIAEERHLIVNGEIKKKIDAIKDIYKDSELYKVENYFEKNTDG
ncbi:hypothetical protein R83H12_02233 [Fibrobacteria bacterium R8-3-H12]